jgi:hypothetical protein
MRTATGEATTRIRTQTIASRTHVVADCHDS